MAQKTGSGKIFIVEELSVLRGTPPPGGYQRFEWTAANRSIPRAPWPFGVKQRTVRTDYPGADDPTEQILGPNYTDFTLEGVWDDRYNPKAGPLELGPTAEEARTARHGFALEEWQRFELMVRRGNPVRITFQEVQIQGIITSADFEFFTRNRIGYRFTLSPHHRQPGGFFALKKSPRTALNAKQMLTEISEEVDTLLTYHELAPQLALVDTLYDDVNTYVEQLATGLVSIEDAIDQRNLSTISETNVALLRIGSLFYEMATLAVNLIDVLKAYDSSEALDFENGERTLNFDVWSRGLMYQARRIVVVSYRAASDLQQRAYPQAMRLYRPQAGESLYAISNRFYQSPHNWRLIAERNGLDDFALTGEELLIIPEATQR